MSDNELPIIPEVVLSSMDDDLPLDGVNEDVTSSELTTADNYPVALRNTAYDLFLNNSCDFTDIGIELAVPREVVMTWARRGKWVKRKEELEALAMRSTDANFVSFLAKNKMPEAKRQLELTETMEELLLAALKVQKGKNAEDVKVVDLERLTKAIEKATSVGARLMKITELPEGVDRNGQPIQGAGGKGPLVVIGVASNPVAPGITVNEYPGQ